MKLLRLRWKEDINFDKRIVTLWTRKRKDGAYESNPMPMDDVLYDILWQRWKSRDQDKWAVLQFQDQNQVSASTKGNGVHMPAAGIAPIGNGKRKLWRGKDKGKVVEVPLFYGFHSLRHFTASYLADQEKVSLKTVSGLLRHKNLRTTEIYLHHLDPSHQGCYFQNG